MTHDDQTKTQNEQAAQETETARTEQTYAPNPDTETDNMEEDAELEGFPGMDADSLDAGMFGQVQEMMARLERADELEKENADLRGKLGRLAADFESYRRRTQEDVQAAQQQGVAKAAEGLMPVYDDLDRAVSMGSNDPSKLIPGVQAVQATVLRVFGNLGLEATGREGEHFDPQWHEALQVVPGDEDDVIVQVYQLGFRMGDRLVRPARVVVSRKQ
ncbi:HSP-70 cofactor GrpE [Deinococcus aerius]|uniref:Protein GrpE n=1 Tax=Deinococcus aerius TaxID=200253 RepID=A0A2I9D0Z9_9DEIO|nr:nucleotide exchange factor GrpE [Deinococcus aerius]GBF08229.1 HSP-70 cofactor GrpE [Deinococcus aerius]